MTRNNFVMNSLAVLGWMLLWPSSGSAINGIATLLLLSLWHPRSRFLSSTVGAFVGLMTSFVIAWVAIERFHGGVWADNSLQPIMAFVSGGISGWLVSRSNRILPDSAKEFALLGLLFMIAVGQLPAVLIRYGVAENIYKLRGMDLGFFLPYASAWYAVPGLIAALLIWPALKRDKSLTGLILVFTPILMSALALPVTLFIGPSFLGFAFLFAFTIKSFGLFPILWTIIMTALGWVSLRSSIGGWHGVE